MASFRPPPVTEDIVTWAKSIYAGHVWAHAIDELAEANRRLAMARVKDQCLWNRRIGRDGLRASVVEWALVIRKCEQLAPKPKHYRSQAKKVFAAPTWHYDKDGDLSTIDKVPVTFDFRPRRRSGHMGHARAGSITIFMRSQPYDLESFLGRLDDVERIVTHEACHVAQYALGESFIGFPSRKIRDGQSDLHGWLYGACHRQPQRRHCFRDVEFWTNFVDMSAHLREMLEKAPERFRPGIFRAFCADYSRAWPSWDHHERHILRETTGFFTCEDRMLPLKRDAEGKWKRYAKALAVACDDLL